MSIKILIFHEKYILDILIIYSKVLSSAKLIICDGHWYLEEFRKFIKARD